MYIYRRIFKMLGPTFISYLGFALVGVIDAFMIGTKIDNGLAAMSLTIPVIYIMTGLIFSLAIGSITKINIQIGYKDYKKAGEIFFNNLVLGMLMLYVLVFLVRIFDYRFLKFLTDDPYLMKEAHSYLSVFLLFLPLLFAIYVCANIIKSQGDMKLIMIISLLAILVNTMLNYVFLFKLNLDLPYVALATGISYVVQALFSTFYYRRSKVNRVKFKRKKLDLSIIWQSFVNGSSEGANDYSKAITSALYNKKTFIFLGALGLNLIGLMNYLYMFSIIIFASLADSILPLISISYGERNYEDIAKYKRGAIIISLVYGVIAFLLIFYNRYFILDIANIDINNNINIDYIFAAFFLSLLVLGINIILMSSLTAIEWGIPSLIYSLFKNLIFVVLFIMLLSNLFGYKGLFIAFFVSEVSSLMLGIALTKRYGKNYRNVI